MSREGRRSESDLATGRGRPTSEETPPVARLLPTASHKRLRAIEVVGALSDTEVAWMLTQEQPSPTTT